jgi:hypothetical protein
MLILLFWSALRFGTLKLQTMYLVLTCDLQA